MDKFVGDQAAGLRRLLGQTGFQVITVMSGQQGAGKTAATANLAVALARSGRDVLIIDQDRHDHRRRKVESRPRHGHATAGQRKRGRIAATP